MLELLFKTSFRNLLKNKMLTTINVLGLSIGITCALIIYLIISHENNFDKYHSKIDNIYHLYTEMHFGENQSFNQGVPYPVHEAIEEELPEVKILGELLTAGGATVQLNKEKEAIELGKLAGVDTSYFKIFDWEWIAGNPELSLANKESVILTEKTALKFFGTLDVVGKDFQLNKEHSVTVTGLLKNPPAPSNFEFGAFVPIALIDGSSRENAHWSNVASSYQNYIVVAGEGEELQASVNELEQKIYDLYQSKKPNKDLSWEIKMQPLKAMHFNPVMYPNTGRSASLDVLWALFAIAVVLILSVCINYINLSTAFATLRSSEIGVRKVLGSSKRLLVFQFLSETFVLISLALVISFCLTELMLSNMHFFIDWGIDQNLFRNALKTDWLLYLFIPALILLLTLLSGIYPAILASSFNPIDAIKNKISAKGTRGFSMRRALVLLQFGLCQIFIFGTIVVMQQLEFARTNDLGFDRDHIVNVHLPWEEQDKRDVLQNEWGNISGISDISFSSQAPMMNGWSATTITLENDSTSEEKQTNLIEADPNYFGLYKFNFLAGKPYHESDSLEEIIVNQQFLSLMGLEDPYEAIGKQVFYDEDYPLTITGVVSDFHLNSFKEEIKPLMMGMDKNSLYVANIKVNPLTQKETLAALESKWKEVYPDQTFNYGFLEDDIYKMYKNEEQTYRLFNLFAGIAIFISCLGLYGLISFISLQRTKEIGIRKVLGASVKQIVYLFSKEFIILVLTALVLAGPAGYYIMTNWLEDYAYKIDLTWDIFAITLVVSMLIALATVSYQSIRSALQNPVDALHAD
ncbi:ABC transporter permease [Flammeovirgaceae bacterium SG7u.111]|nr:ABC transporter permease [Flammeovirgaceae bacterium SG7u.132]WPO34066.1 ABC transporter permease [Flammeovirgaceae bacterium SG7u.111]